MGITEYMKSEPVILQGLIQAGLGLGVAFGLHLSTAQLSAVLALSAGILSLITRQFVTPYPAPYTPSTYKPYNQPH